MAEFPALPLWTDAYLADCSHLTDAEHGRYFLMLQHMWRAPNRRFPNDDAWLARKFGRTVDDIQTLFRPLIAEFFRTDGNWLYHKRLEREWERLSEMSRKQSERAKSRWSKGNDESRGNAKRGIATTTTSTTISLKKESPLKTPPEPEPQMPAPKARAVRVRKEYSEAFERLWHAYPVRDEDTKAACHKHWLRIVTTADVESVIGAAGRWRREQAANPYRIGLLRWLRDQEFNREPPAYRPNGHAADDGWMNAVREVLRAEENPDDESGLPAVLEGACGGMPDETEGRGQAFGEIGRSVQIDAGGLHRRAAVLPGSGSNGWMRTVGATEADVAVPIRAGRVH